jgi:hypothetical protein
VVRHPSAPSLSVSACVARELRRERETKGVDKMTTTFDERELETLRKGATGTGMLVAVSDRSFFDSFKEAGALAGHMAEARRSSSSELIKQIAQGRGTGFGLTDTPEEIERETMQALQEARQILESKSPQELEEYRSFVLELARSVSSAAGGGEEAETTVIQKVEQSLA